MRQPSPSEKILENALRDYNTEYYGDPLAQNSFRHTPDVERMDAILGAILDYLDNYAEHSHGE